MKSLFQIRSQTACACRARDNLQSAWLRLAFLAISFHGAIAAEGPISAVQEGLKRQKFYFGETTGELDQETRAALRSFQNRHGLPPTGEVDTATIEMLQAKSAVVTPAAQNSTAKSSEPTPAVVEKDRKFLQKVEAGVEPLPPKDQASSPSAPPLQSVPSTATSPVPAAPAAAVREPALAATPPAPAEAPASIPPVTPPRPPAFVQPALAAPPEATAPAVVSGQAGAETIESIPQDSRTEVPRQPIARNRSAEKPRQVTSRKMERPPLPKSRDASATLPPEAQPTVSELPRRVEPRYPPRLTSDNDPDPVGSHGTRIIRSTGTATSPDGTTYLYEKKTTTVSSTPMPVRRAESVEPRRKRDGFFDRLFKGDGD